MNKAHKEQEERRVDPHINESMRLMFATRVERLKAAKKELQKAYDLISPLTISNGYDEMDSYDNGYTRIVSELRSLIFTMESRIEFMETATETYYGNMSSGAWGRHIAEVDALLERHGVKR